MTTKKLIKLAHLVGAALLAGILSTAARSASLDLADSPLFVGINAPPNLLLAVDMSGSMDSEVIFPTNDGALWWNTDRRSFTDRDDALNFNTSGSANGTWKKYVYLFPNGYGSGNRLYNDAANDHYGIPPIPQFAFTRSPAYNPAYFDPTKVYEPWLDVDDQTFDDANPQSAISDPRIGSSNRVNLTNEVRRRGDGEKFFLQQGMVLPRNTVIYSNGSWRTVNQVYGGDHMVNSGTDGAEEIAYYPATFYLPESSPLPACFGYNEKPLTGFAPDGSRMLGYEIKPGNFSGGGGDCGGVGSGYSAMMQNFANWFVYARKRNLAVKDGIVRSFNNERRARVGANEIDNLSGGGGVSIRDFADSDDRNSFMEDIYDYRVGGGTPNREAVRRLGQLYATDRNIIQNQCQQNFGVLFTDGYATTWDGAGVGNVDNDGGPEFGHPVFSDNSSNTMADIAAHYYKKLENEINFGGVKPGRLPTPAGCDVADPAPWLDCQSKLHMTTFGVTLGQSGLIFGTDADATENPYENVPNWNSLSFGERGPSQIDDLWHATINSRGRLLNATTPQDVVTQFRAVLNDIASRQGAASAVSINSGVVSATSRIYQAKFRPPDWSGSLLARPLSDGNANATCPANAPAGSVCAAVWDADCELTGGSCRESGLGSSPGIDHDDRVILTFNPYRGSNGNGEPFRPGGLLVGSLAGLYSPVVVNAVASVTGNLTADEVNHIRGDRSEEGPNSNDLRERNSLLGDIVHSGPAFEGVPQWIGYPLIWKDNLYPGTTGPESDYFANFRNPYFNRRPMVYVGANDGMLHGFDADTGKEVFGYIPVSLYPKLKQLTSNDYDHDYFVDGSPSTTDAFFDDGQWHTVLTSGLRGGGQAVFALDVTGDANGATDNFFTESATDASKVALWEFMDRDLPYNNRTDGDRDMGYSFAQPQTVRAHNGKWVTIFGNGFDNTHDDGSASTTGNAVLYVVDTQTGELLSKLDTGVGMSQDPANDNNPNGLATATPVDLDGDLIVDYVYAGDLFGNVWQFDLTSNSADGWEVGLGSAGTPTPLFRARDGSGEAQPITTAPVVSAHPLGVNYGIVVYFGTGKYLETADKSPNTSITHSFYGVRDTNVFTFTRNPPYTPTKRQDFRRADLQVQTISQQVSSNGELLRIVSDNPPDQRDLFWEPDTCPSGSSAPACKSNAHGFYLDLAVNGINEGEMLTSDPVIRRDLIVFSSLIPQSTTCEAGADGFLYALDRRSGGRFFEPVFDLNDDNQFNDTDTFEPDGAKIGFSGIALDGGGGTTPGFAIADALNRYYVNGSRAEVDTDILNIGGPPEGRRTWRELRR